MSGIVSAVREGSVKRARELLKTGKSTGDINSRDWNGRGLIHHACEGGHLDMVRMLVTEFKADINSSCRQGQYPIHHACRWDHLNMVRMLVKEFKVNVNLKDRYGQSPIHHACCWGHLDMIRMLVTELNADWHGLYLIHHACESDNLDVIRMLVTEFKADVNCGPESPLLTALDYGHQEVAVALISEFACDVHFNEVLYLACYEGFASVVNALIDKHGCGWASSNSDRTLQIPLKYSDKEDLVSCLISKLGYDVNWADAQGKTLLHHACWHGHLDMVRMLVSKFNADVNIDTESGGTPLHTALAQSQVGLAVALIKEFGCSTCDMGVIYLVCKQYLLNVIEALIMKHGPSVFGISSGYDQELRVPVEYRKGNLVSHLIDQLGNDQEWTGITLLTHAIYYGYIDMMKMLVSKFKVVLSEHLSNSILHAILAQSDEEVALVLITEFGYGNDKEVVNMSCRQGLVCVVKALVNKHGVAVLGGHNPPYFNKGLMLAVEYGKEETMCYLIDQLGLDVNSKDRTNSSLLHFACQYGHEHMVETLLHQYKADVNIFNDKGSSPLHVAVEQGRKAVILALIRFGCDPRLAGYLGRSVLHYACIFGNSFLVRSLTKYVSPLIVDDNGDTPLHYAFKLNKWDCVQVLLECKAPILVRNNAGETPQDKAAQFPILLGLFEKYIEDNKAMIFTNYEVIQKHAKKKYGSTDRITRVFVIGNPGAGKSSLIETLKREGFMDSFRRVSSRSVPLHTAGIVPSSYVSKKSGKVLFYDFAGDPEYYSSHATILENVASSKKGDNVFFIVIDLREKNILNILRYWHSFIQYQRSQRPSLIVVGSHFDLISKDVVEAKKREFHIFLDAIPCGMYCHSEYLLLDCCQPKSKQIAAIQNLVCEVTVHSPQYSLSTQSSVLLGLLEMDFRNVPACSMEVLISHIEKTGLPLPTVSEGLSPLLHELHDLGLLFVVGNCKSKGSPIQLVLNVAKLTNIVHETIFF